MLSRCPCSVSLTHRISLSSHLDRILSECSFVGGPSFGGPRRIACCLATFSICRSIDCVLLVYRVNTADIPSITTPIAKAVFVLENPLLRCSSMCCPEEEAEEAKEEEGGMLVGLMCFCSFVVSSEKIFSNLFSAKTSEQATGHETTALLATRQPILQLVDDVVFAQCRQENNAQGAVPATEPFTLGHTGEEEGLQAARRRLPF